MHRRRLLQGALASGGAVALGAALGTDVSARAATPSGRMRVRLGYLGNPCEAITFDAPSSAFFNGTS